MNNRAAAVPADNSQGSPLDLEGKIADDDDEGNTTAFDEMHQKLREKEARRLKTLKRKQQKGSSSSDKDKVSAGGSVQPSKKARKGDDKDGEVLKKPSYKWTAEKKRILVDHLMEEVAKHGNFTDGAGFKSQAWNRILTAYVSKTDDIVTANQLQSQWNELKKKYGQYQWLLDQSGPGWNAKDQIITASDDCWKAIFVGKPELKWCKERNPYSALHTDMLALYYLSIHLLS